MNSQWHITQCVKNQQIMNMDGRDYSFFANYSCYQTNHYSPVVS
ncbi:hypothetical protein BN1221_00017c [Brenneria goodwinii]|uniref:Uncharacterized protein n=1 Tax=Brenneria goodwinii TaxID=1109412 RepID=A0A0G4JPJ8_9GAMM|nr:hypothetical protein BN1221_00017c [Brenneria goodwinii]